MLAVWIPSHYQLNRAGWGTPSTASKAVIRSRAFEFVTGIYYAGHMQHKFQLRQLGAIDLITLRDIAEETFLDTFAAQNEPENITEYVAAAFSSDRVAAELENKESEFFFIENGSDVAGYLKLNRGTAQTEQSVANALEVERIYVRRKHQGTGAGKALMLHAISMAGLANLDWLWLGVWDQNVKAIEFYKKSGFVEFAHHDFYMGKELQRDIMMKLAITGS